MINVQRPLTTSSRKKDMNKYCNYFAGDARPSTRCWRGPGAGGSDAEEVRRLPERPPRQRSAPRRDERDRRAAHDRRTD